MNKSLIIGLLSFITIQLAAQTDTIPWFEDLTTAKTYAAENQRDILMVFAGSDWCRPCIQFKQDILVNEEFQAWGSQHLVILYLDFPARRKNKLSSEQTAHNEALAEEFNKSGAFPNIFLLNREEVVLANPAFKGQTTADFITNLNNQLTVHE